MKIEVRYYSKSGNTKKLADAIAKEVGVTAKTTSERLTEDVDILFLGSSVYYHGVDKEVKEFINGIDVKVGKVINFSTAAIIKSTYNQIEGILKKKGITLAKEEFHCKGSFAALYKGKPDEIDLKNVSNFAKEIVK